MLNRHPFEQLILLNLQLLVGVLEFLSCLVSLLQQGLELLFVHVFLALVFFFHLCQHTHVVIFHLLALGYV